MALIRVCRFDACKRGTGVEWWHSDNITVTNSSMVNATKVRFGSKMQ